MRVLVNLFVLIHSQLGPVSMRVFVNLFVNLLWRFRCHLQIGVDPKNLNKAFIQLTLEILAKQVCFTHVKIGFIPENLYPWFHEY